VTVKGSSGIFILGSLGRICRSTGLAVVFLVVAVLAVVSACTYRDLGDDLRHGAFPEAGNERPKKTQTCPH
jgi:predicted small secreted protein